MMNNLFSVFDPTSSIMSMSLNWMSSLVGLLLIPFMYWVMKSRKNMVLEMMTTSLKKEFSSLTKTNKFNLMMFSLIFMIMMNNTLGLTPYTFTSTSHLLMTLSLALPMWSALMLFGWIKKTNDMFTHLLPQGTPSLLMPFMVMIETISSLIRPGTLSIRLAANMIAGHLLLTLLGNQGPSIPDSLLSTLLITQVLLLLLESAVALIQSYVFTILMTLYLAEVNY